MRIKVDHVRIVPGRHRPFVFIERPSEGRGAAMRIDDAEAKMSALEFPSPEQLGAVGFAVAFRQKQEIADALGRSGHG